MKDGFDTRSLELSLDGKKYGFIIVDGYSRYTCIYFVSHKHELTNVFEIFFKRTIKLSSKTLLSKSCKHKLLCLRNKTKLDEDDKVIRNKTKLVAQGYNHQEGIDFIEIFATLTRL
ncbi:hypothetical protein CR513_25172, partial [Mucuna pruriens]